ncbi:MAG: hypothetical protein RMJ48_09420 [Roseiflexaceae bacterium]|nr:hypothetical protein [Roseiflexaceae bacterium]
MTAPDLEQTRAQIGYHLQFLGYEVSVDEKTVLARHPTKPNIIIQMFNEGVLFASISGCGEAASLDRTGFLEFINAANGHATVSRYYAGTNNNFFLEAWHSGDYRQVDFARFVSLWEMDFERLKQVPGISMYPTPPLTPL